MTDEYIEFTCGKCFHEYISTSPIAECPVCLPTPKTTTPDRPKRPLANDFDDIDDMPNWGNMNDTPWKSSSSSYPDYKETSKQKAAAHAGVKHDDGKPRWDLLPMDALNDVAAVLTFGAKKYEERNWEKGMAYGRLQAAAMRHIAAWSIGEELDLESELPHLAHAACCVLMLLAHAQRGTGFDDRTDADV